MLQHIYFSVVQSLIFICIFMVQSKMSIAPKKTKKKKLNWTLELPTTNNTNMNHNRYSTIGQWYLMLKSQLVIYYHMGQYTCVSNDEWSPITALRNERGKFPTRNLSQYEWGRGERKRMPFLVCLLGFSLSLSPFLSWGLRREEKRT